MQLERFLLWTSEIVPTVHVPYVPNVQRLQVWQFSLRFHRTNYCHILSHIDPKAIELEQGRAELRQAERMLVEQVLVE
jgi:hypothetical protein